MKLKRITILLPLLVVLLAQTVSAQITIERQVLGATGGFDTGTGFTISSTVGEPMVTTEIGTNILITQGFQQPQRTNDSIVTYFVSNESCIGAKNGIIDILDVKGCPGPYTFSIRSVDDSTTFLGNDTLASGDYIVDITGSNSCQYSITLYVGIEADEICNLIFFSGYTPNGDGTNDVWVIENIEQFPDNVVKIFNRFGDEVWSGEGYDNTNVVWEGFNNGGEQLGDATYFYVAEVNGKIYKGWVELTR